MSHRIHMSHMAINKKETILTHLTGPSYAMSSRLKTNTCAKLAFQRNLQNIPKIIYHIFLLNRN
jgi:hypothetical protein